MLYDHLKTVFAMHSIWEWCKDILIPAIGAVFIPILIWYFGAVRAEQQKELHQLRDKLNLLLSLCWDGICKLMLLRTALGYLNEIQRRKLDEINEEDLRKIMQVYFSPIDFSSINVADYSPCIKYNANYVIELVQILSAIKIKDFKIEHHNFQIKSIAESSDLSQKRLKLNELITIERSEFPQFREDIGGIILLIRDFIMQTKILEKKIKGLKLENVKYSAEQLALFAELEKASVKDNNDC
jgi:hypothetical protein